ncbi:3-oxoadipate enol-lactonase [Prauserella sp. PE36]|uniref:alpha/beta fold hydrolase n=1 Tax=Prauserella sp. PE36 TaxID=1504709 RepID=UPI000DE22FF4|nr:alpha/beta fold hydrolase [Prauserella sp. PE36]RBM21857.1 3-oxoadipate enol-lactonase [Prauserella sp. PE36]
MRSRELGLVRTSTGGETRSDSAVLFVNSLATTARMWDGVISSLPAGIATVRYDQRDRGLPAGETSFTVDDLVDDLFAALDAAEVESAHVVGVSLGGLVGLRAAAVAPGRVRTLTAICCAARFRRDVWVERGRLVRAGNFPSLVPGIIDRWFTPEFQREHPGIVAARRAELEATDQAGYAAACEVLATADVNDDLPAIQAPTLAVSGEADTANPVTDLEHIAWAVPMSRHVMLPRTAHLAPVEQPGLVAGLVHRHISDYAPSGGAAR